MIGHDPRTLRHSRTASGTAMRSRLPCVGAPDVLGGLGIDGYVGIEIMEKSIQSCFGAGIAVCGWISIARTVSDGSPRLILRWRCARVRWKVHILYFPINVMKCYEIPQNVMKNTKIL